MFLKRLTEKSQNWKKLNSCFATTQRVVPPIRPQSLVKAISPGTEAGNCMFKYLYKPIHIKDK